MEVGGGDGDGGAEGFDEGVGGDGGEEEDAGDD